MKRTVLVRCTSGLSNRIKGLVTGMRAASELDIDLLVYWEVNNSVDSEMHELFKSRFKVVKKGDYEELIESPDVLLINTWRLWASPKDKFPKHFKNSYPSPHRYGIDFQYANIPENVRAAYLPYFGRLDPVDSIRNAVDGLFTGETRPITGMAVRTWSDAPQRRKLFDYGAVSGIVAETNGPIFLTSDSKQLVNAISQEFFEKIIPSFSIQSDSTRQPMADAQKTLCDIYSLARCGKMFASFASTFSEVAWWIGGGTASVQIINPKRYALKVVDLGEVVGYAIAGLWKFKTKTKADAYLAGMYRRIFG